MIPLVGPRELIPSWIEKQRLVRGGKGWYDGFTHSLAQIAHYGWIRGWARTEKSALSVKVTEGLFDRVIALLGLGVGVRFARAALGETESVRP
jgi:hypothetical protein